MGKRVDHFIFYFHNDNFTTILGIFLRLIRELKSSCYDHYQDIIQN